MNQFAIHILVHPPYIKFLKDHLISLKNAKKSNKIPVNLLLSRLNNEEIREIKNIINLVNIDIDLVYSYRKTSPGEGRNILWKSLPAKWHIFFDADTLVDRDYFDNLNKVNLKNEYAIAGGIGIASATKYGFWEGVNDQLIYLKSIDMPLSKFLEVRNKLFRNISRYKDYNEGFVKDYLIKNYKKDYTLCLQGYNQIISEYALNFVGGFSKEYWSAEDRDMSIKLTANKFHILFLPGAWLSHHYNFEINDIIKRKLIHGLGYGRLRRDHRNLNHFALMGLRKWLRNILISIVNPPFPFTKNKDSRLYYLISFVCYSVAGMSSQYLKFNILRDKVRGWSYSRDKI